MGHFVTNCGFWHW